jgi:hypothetical protein
MQKTSRYSGLTVMWLQVLIHNIEDLKKLFVHAPDTRIKEHPIKFGSGNYTLVTGVFEGTFTKPCQLEMENSFNLQARLSKCQWLQ